MKYPYFIISILTSQMASKLRQLVNRVSEMEDLHRKREAHLNVGGGG